MRRQEKERHGDGPTRLKTAVAADLLRKLIAGMGSYAQVVTALVDELLSAVIVDFAQHVKPKMKVNAANPNPSPFSNSPFQRIPKSGIYSWSTS